MAQLIYEGGPAVIGDPHLGKKFTTGVPLHRRGERERKQFDLFRQELTDGMRLSKTVIVMGDLFDKFDIDAVDLYDTALLLKEVANTAPAGTYFYIIRGNHDVSRYLAKKSSFDLLEVMLEDNDTVKLIMRPEFINHNGDYLLLIPYDAMQSTRELMTGMYRGMLKEKYKAILGHWDIESYGGDDYNLIPYDSLSPALAEGGVLVTGHVHEAQIFHVPDTNIKLIVTGSMQPYSHGEDDAGNIYVTISPTEYFEHPEAYKDKAIRFLLKPGETVPDNIDALQISHKYVDENLTEEQEVRMGEFSFKDLFYQVFDAHGVDRDTTDEHWTIYQGKNSDANEA